jgi:tetratricopeptide (TPR) repeat protein
MNMGHGFAWEKDWPKSVAAYARALQEIPEDPESHKFLGFALLQTARYTDALKVLGVAHRLAPDDPVPLERSADVLERLGRLSEAANQYIAVAEVYLAQRDIERAIGSYERAIALTPGLLQVHFKLAQLYERLGRKRSAVLQYLTLAFNFQRTKDKPRALQAIERALRLEPSNPQVINAKRAIESGEFMAIPAGESAPKKTDSGRLFDAFQDAPAAEPEPPSAAGPLGEATERALALLAEQLLDGGLTTAEAQAIQAIELHKMGEAQGAARAYQSAEKLGVRHLSMWMALGSVLVQLGQWPEAKKYLERARAEQRFAAGAAHGLGQVYIGLGQPREASRSLIQALQLADIELALNPDEASQLAYVYDQLQESTRGMQDGDLANTNLEFNRWLTGPNWKVHIRETRRAIEDRIRRGAANEIIDILHDPTIVEMLTRVDSYMKQGLYTLAIDEAMRAIEKQPLLLPAHQRVAQILMEEGETQAAINKYSVVVNSYLARDDRGNAATILNEVIKIAPMDTGLRLSLIELLERENQQERMLEEYLGLADAYYQLAEVEQARDMYQEAARLAQRLNAPAERRAEILARLAEIYLSRMDLRQAQRTYEQVRTLLPEDERPRRELIEINYRLNNPLEAVKELDGLLRLYAQTRRGDRIVSLLEALVESHQTDMALRSRLAAVYRQLNRRADAIAQLDALGELQLEAGLYSDACTTIKQIIALQPGDLTQYQTLLAQLGC